VSVNNMDVLPGDINICCRLGKYNLSNILYERHILASGKNSVTDKKD